MALVSNKEVLQNIEAEKENELSACLIKPWQMKASNWKLPKDRQSVSVNRTDTSIRHSKQLDNAIPASKIAALSSREFVGLVADNPNEKIKLKMFNAEIVNDEDKLNDELNLYKKIPIVSNVTQ